MIEWHTCTYRVSSAHLLIAQRYEPALHLQGLRQTYHSDSVLTTGLDRSVVANGRSDVCRSAAVGSGERGIVEAGRDTSGEQRREEEEGRGARPSWKAKLVRFLKALRRAFDCHSNRDGCFQSTVTATAKVFGSSKVAD